MFNLKMEKVKSKTSAPNKLQRTVGKQKKTMARARRSLKRLAFWKTTAAAHVVTPYIAFPFSSRTLLSASADDGPCALCRTNRFSVHS